VRACQRALPNRRRRVPLRPARSSANPPPEQLHADLTATATWLTALSSARPGVVVGLVALEAGGLQRAALPVLERAHR
jgi:hypothetical protein